jgi:hypothetical protein
MRSNIGKEIEEQMTTLGTPRVLVRLDHVVPGLDGSLRRGRLTSSPPQFEQTKFSFSAQLPQYVHS